MSMKLFVTLLVLTTCLAAALVAESPVLSVVFYALVFLSSVFVLFCIRGKVKNNQ